MARYKVVINTDAYVCKSCSKKNWEPGTMNDFMIAINGWHSTERSIKEVIWRLKMFAGYGWNNEEWDNENNCLRADYQKWKAKKCNTITYLDRLCGFERTREITVYGFAQGYLDISRVIQELKENGVAKIPFSVLYDPRQYYRGMNGCYMEITKIS